MTATKTSGSLIIIGGHEDKEGEKTILREVCRKAMKGGGRLVIMTVATKMPQEHINQYTPLFTELGVREVVALDVRERADAHNPENVAKLDGAAVVFFVGGDQLRITSQIGGSPIFERLQQIYREGGTIAGTSAGAAAMPETMLVSGDSDQSSRIATLNMAPGLALIAGVVIDSHFAERGRIGRLVGAVAQNPRNIGIGIDEDTAIVVENDCFEVIGSGGVYVLDGQHLTYSSLSDKNTESVISIYGATLHVLGHQDHFDLTHCTPLRPHAKA